MSDAPGNGNDPEREETLRVAAEIRSLAHDLNNTLMPLMMGLSLLRKKVADPSLDRTLTNMEKSVRRAAELTNEILAIGRRHSAKPDGETSGQG
ncbi:MAG: hypothetical protein NDJ92_16045 [Thermoanaerobaculia bacterium]|nr:hypothetical protein [Thermoanaerobaculia bacterium]